MSQRGNSEGTLIGFGLLAFLAISIYFIARSAPSSERFPPLNTYSPRPNGALALYDLAQQAGFTAERQLDSEYHYPQGGTVVLLDASLPDPSSMLLGGLDVKALSVWLREGGTLLLLASPRSADLTRLQDELREQADSELHAGAYGLGSGNSAAVLAEADALPVQAAHNRAGIVSPSRSNYIVRTAMNGEIYKLEEPLPPLLAGVSELELASPDHSYDYPGAALLEAGDPASPLVAWLPVGEGQLLWVSAPELASNAWISRADNHRLLLNLLSYAAPGGTLYFDEHYHGYSEQGPGMIGLLTRTAGGQLLLALLALCALAFAGAAIAPARFLPPPVPPRRQSTEMVLAQGSLYQRAGLRRPVAMLLLDGLRQAVRQYEHWGSAPDDKRLADWLHGAAARGLPVDPLLLQLLDGKLVIGSPRQLLLFARACDKLRAALG